MPTATMKEIPRGEWASFFDVFGRTHEGWIVTLEILRPDIGAQIEVRGMHLGGLVLNAKPSTEQSVSILVGETPATHVTHTVVKPRRVVLETTESDAGDFETLEIESEARETALIRFHAGAVPEIGVDLY